jgi:hypothetical protein
MFAGVVKCSCLSDVRRWAVDVCSGSASTAAMLFSRHVDGQRWFGKRHCINRTAKSKVFSETAVRTHNDRTTK